MLQDFSLQIPAGQKVGIVGYSGSGQSTFVKLILRLYDIQQGKICIDSQDISTVIQDSLRDGIGLIPPQADLLDCSLRDNIQYRNASASDEEIIAVAKQAHAHDFIMKIAGRYEAITTSQLSEGQLQRIMIARRALKNASILMMDEATSHLDPVTEKYIRESMDVLMQNKTVIVVAHRLTTLLQMDLILVFDGER